MHTLHIKYVYRARIIFLDAGKPWILCNRKQTWWFWRQHCHKRPRFTGTDLHDSAATWAGAMGIHRWQWIFDRKITIFNRRKFRSQTSDNMDRWKAEQGRGREKRKIRREKIRRERVRRQKMQMREKVGKSRNCVFPMIWGSGGSKSRLAKAAGAEPAGQMRDENLHAVVARSTFWSQNVQNTPWSDHFWKLRCRKSARRCGAKHISKWKCTKHTILGPLLEVEMSKKCTPLWREAHFEVKSVKNWRSRTTFGGSDVEKVSKKCTLLWREAHFEVKSVKKLRVLSLFWRADVEKVDTD